MAAGQQISASARAWALSKEIFGQRISDHVPQEFTFAPKGAQEKAIKVLSWNVMARALCRRRSGRSCETQMAFGYNDCNQAKHSLRAQLKLAYLFYFLT